MKYAFILMILALFVINCGGGKKPPDLSVPDTIPPVDKKVAKNDDDIKKEEPQKIDPKFIYTFKVTLIAFKESVPIANPKLTKEQAKKKAEELQAQLSKKDADWAKITEKADVEKQQFKKGYSVLAMNFTNPEKLPPELGLHLTKLKVGDISAPIETKAGFYVFQRIETEEYTARHVLVMYKGSQNAPAEITRTKEEAKKKSEEILKQLKAPDADFATIAAKNSDCPSKKQGGFLGSFIRGSGQLDQDFEEATVKLKPGETSNVVETQFGFHIIKRESTTEKPKSQD
ncbi:MAG: peptidylprolyl isomerase [Candidatus Coatesbacteria bacterium]|nr:peptidylprolyl isomerase [Candidatus Coatesbacteria bacterium]